MILNNAENFKVEQLLSLIGLGATVLLVLGIFYSSGQASIIGSPYLSSFTYTDTLIQAFEPLKQLVFLIAFMAFITFLFLPFAFILIWVTTVLNLISALTFGKFKRRKMVPQFKKIEEQLHVETISAATMRKPNFLHLIGLERRAVSLEIWRKSIILANQSHNDYVALLKDLISGRWYQLNTNNTENNWSVDTLVSFLSKKRYTIKFNSVISFLIIITSLTIYFYLEQKTGTIYFSWLFIATFYTVVVVLLRIAKFANSEGKPPTPIVRLLGYIITAVVGLSFMFLLGRDDVRAKHHLNQYTMVYLVKGTPKCGKNLAGNSSLLVLDSNDGVILIPWRQIASVTHNRATC